MSILAPKMSRVAPSVGRLARATLRVAPASSLAPRVAKAALCRQPTHEEPTQRSFHNTTARSVKRDPIQHSPAGLLPEFSLKDKVIVVSGGAQGLGLVQAEALLEAGAKGKAP